MIKEYPLHIRTLHGTLELTENSQGMTNLEGFQLSQEKCGQPSRKHRRSLVWQGQSWFGVAGQAIATLRSSGGAQTVSDGGIGVQWGPGAGGNRGASGHTGLAE